MPFGEGERALLFPILSPRGEGTDTPGMRPYGYYNATVGMLSLLILTGNFLH
jgi:hypothetical protein